jgi:hypothetical protein
VIHEDSPTIVVTPLSNCRASDYRYTDDISMLIKTLVAYALAVFFALAACSKFGPAADAVFLPHSFMVHNYFNIEINLADLASIGRGLFPGRFKV